MTQRQCHVIAHGRVQGVFYRASTVSRAEQLGIHGWVRNRRDGTVEAVLSGSEDAVADMLQWMEQGPEAARVEHLAVHDHDAVVAPGFETRATV